jgi:hypothetical protein
MDYAALRFLIESWRDKAEGLRSGSVSPEMSSEAAWARASCLDQCADEIEDLIPTGGV